MANEGIVAKIKELVTSRPLLTVCSHNVACDSTSEKMDKVEGTEDLSFTKRFHTFINNFKIYEDNIHVVAFNEIRYKENVELVLKVLSDNGYEAKSFANNDSSLSFNNVLGVLRSCKWKPTKWEHKWTAFNENQSILSDSHAVIEGDPHGRSVGIVYLHHSGFNKKVCVAVSHTSPFGDVKIKQQDAIFSLNCIDPATPTIIVGDLNRFQDEDSDFQRRLLKFNLSEAHLSKLLVRSASQTIWSKYKNENDIGTFMPWPVDAVYDEKRRESLSTSKLDVQLYTKELIVCENAYARASMMHSSSAANQKDSNEVRNQLDGKMTSDHIPIIGKYRIK